MQTSYLIGAVLFAGVSSIAPYEALSADLTDVIRTSKYPFHCSRQCFEPAMDAISANWKITDLANITGNICKTQSEAISCIRRRHYCFYPRKIKNVFAKFEAYLHQRCGLENTFYSQVEKCFKPNIGNAMQKCETKCETNVKTFIPMNERYFYIEETAQRETETTKRLGNICATQQCLLPCLVKDMNAICPASASYILIAIMERLNSMTFMLDITNHDNAYFQLRNLDPRCHFLINRKLQEEVRKGDFSVFENRKNRNLSRIG